MCLPGYMHLKMHRCGFQGGHIGPPLQAMNRGFLFPGGFGGDFGGEVALLEADGAAVAGGLDELGNLGQQAEHQEFAYGRQDRAVDDAHRGEQEASHDEQEASCQGDGKDSHTLSAWRLELRAWRLELGAWG